MSTPRVEARSEQRFSRWFFGPAPATWSLITAFVLMHLLASWFDRHENYDNVVALVLGERSDRTLTLLGGRSHELVLHGQLWRLLTCGFLHHDPLHLFLNSTALAGLGRPAEAVWGPARLLVLFLLSVLGGAMLSQLGAAPLSIGASGGVFGVMGALVAFSWRRRAQLSPVLRGALGRDLLPWIAVNLAIGAVVPAIDNLGHVGGLLTGLAMAFVFGDRITDAGEESAGRRAAWALLAWAMLLVVALGIPVSILLA